MCFLTRTLTGRGERMQASGLVKRGVRRDVVHGGRLFFQKVGAKPSVAARLNYHWAFLRGYEMRDPGRNNDETACRIALEFGLVELLAFDQRAIVIVQR